MSYLKRIMRFLLLILVFLFVFGPCLRKISSLPMLPVHNLDTGISYATIQEALDSPETRDGHVVQVDSGVYYENLEVRKAVMLIGQNKSDTIVDGNYSHNVISILRGNVTIRGFTVQHSGTQEGVEDSCGVFVSRSCFSVNIRYNIITDNSIGIKLSSFNTVGGNNFTGNSYGIYIQENLLGPPSENNTIEGNAFSSNLHGIYFQSSRNNIVKHNVFSDNEYGFYSYQGTNNALVENTVAFSKNMGVTIQDSNRTSLLGNEIYESENCGVELSGSCENMIQQNIVTQNKYTGVSLVHSSDCNTLESNNISLSANGIVIDSSSSNLFENNRILNNTSAGLDSHHSRSNAFINNSVSWNGYGFYSVDSSSDSYSNNSITLNNNTGFVFEYSSYNAIANNSLSENGQGEINLYASSGNSIANNTIDVQESADLNQSALSLSYLSNENTITGNTIIGAGCAINLTEKSNGNIISANTISSSTGEQGIFLSDASNNLVTANNISNSAYCGLEIYGGKRNIITHNNISRSENGLFTSSVENQFSNNRITLCDTGAHVCDDGSLFFGNEFSNCSYGLELSVARNTTFCDNFFFYVARLIYVSACSGCTLFRNNFLGSYGLMGFYGGGIFDATQVKWDNGAEGNYWSNHISEDSDENGIWDEPFRTTIGERPLDNYPLVEPWDQHRVFEILWAQRTFEVRTDSNFTISHLYFDQATRTIAFKITGPPGVEGLCNVTLPRELLNTFQEQWTVTADNETAVANVTSDMTHTTLSVTAPAFDYNATTKTVRIVGTDPIDTIPPLARAGSNVTVQAGTTFIFDGSASTDDVALKDYIWTFVDQEHQTLTGASPVYTFVMPGNHSVMLNVTDLRNNWNTSTIIVNVLGPHAEADANLTVETGVPLILNASGSAGKDLTYTWTFVEGTTKTLSGPTPSYVFSSPGNYVLNLTVTDAVGNSDFFPVTIAVRPVPIWTQPWFWWIVASVSVTLVSTPLGLRYYRNYAKQKRIVIGYESEIETLPISHPDRARARYIRDEIERRGKLAEFQRLYGIRIRPAGTFDDAMSRMGISGYTKKRGRVES